MKTERLENSHRQPADTHASWYIIIVCTVLSAGMTLFAHSVLIFHWCLCQNQNEANKSHILISACYVHCLISLHLTENAPQGGHIRLGGGSSARMSWTDFQPGFCTQTHHTNVWEVRQTSSTCARLTLLSEMPATFHWIWSHQADQSWRRRGDSLQWLSIVFYLCSIIHETQRF